MSAPAPHLPLLPLLLALLLHHQPGHQVQASALLASHMDVFSDLLENIMYSVIRTDNSPAGFGDDVEEGDSDDDLDPGRQGWRESKSRRRVLRTDGPSGALAPSLSSARRKTREETKRSQTK